MRPSLVVRGALLLTLVSVLAFDTSARAPTAVPPALSSPGTVYLALGDSIAAGIGASLPAERGYPALLAGFLTRVAGRHVELVNLAVPGETTTSFIHGGQLDKALQLLADARAAGQRVAPITLTLGANDLLDAPDDAPARERAIQTVRTNLRTILGRLLEASSDPAGTPTADLVVTNYYDPSGTDPSRPGSSAWWLARLNDVIAQETDRAGARLADVAARFAGHTQDWTWYPADIHPTNAGHRAIAEAVWQALGYDHTPPSVRFDRPPAGRLARSIPTVAVVAADQVGVTTVSLAIDGQPGPDLPYLPALGAYATLWDTRGLAPGAHTLTAFATDAAGNVGVAHLTVVVTATKNASPLGGEGGAATPAS